MPLLEARGLTVEALDLPSCGRDTSRLADLDGDTRAVHSLLDRIQGPLLVCAHSYGGVPVTVATAGQRRVRRIVYLTSFMLDAGESCVSIGTGSLPPWCIVRADGAFELDPSAAADVLYGDCDARTQEWAIGRLVPQSTATSTQTVSTVGWRKIPTTYVLCTLDRALPLVVQRRLAERAEETVELPTSHSPFLSRPEAVADLLEARARQSA